MKTLDKQTKEQLVVAVAQRYAAANREKKTHILDEFVALTGFHRKHAIRVLKGGLGNRMVRSKGAKRTRVYDEAVKNALVVIWEASDRICGKRLKPLLPDLLGALERHKHLQLDPDVRDRLVKISSSTIDRLLAPVRQASGKSRRRSKPPAVRSRVPVRTFADWKEPPPGFMEVDLVAHCGGEAAGSFVQTLVLTDIASGWTECVALPWREASLVVDALDRLNSEMPFPLLGIDTDNGTEFINEVVVEFCANHQIDFTRSRPYRKNDQAWVEQKNGAVVRRMVGYGRLEGIAAAESLSRLYGSSRLFVNFFQPSFKLIEKSRIGAKVRKRYERPQTPCARLLGSSGIPDDMKQRLSAVMVTLDPLRLLEEIRAVQHHIAGLGRGEHVHAPPHRDADLDRFFRDLATAWRRGDARPTHQKKVKPPRHWRTRQDPFEEVWPQVLLWLEQEPDRTAKELLLRLSSQQPGSFTKSHLRTLQRRVKDWRAAYARRLVFGAHERDSG